MYKLAHFLALSSTSILSFQQMTDPLPESLDTVVVRYEKHTEKEHCVAEKEIGQEPSQLVDQISLIEQVISMAAAIDAAQAEAQK